MSPLARAAAGACLALVVLTIALRVLGASWVNVAFAVVPLAVGSLLVAVEPRLQWLTRPRPKLTVRLGSREEGRLVSSGLAPWPLDRERILANESAEALATVRDPGILDSILTSGTMGFVSRPSEDETQQAKEKFAAEVETYKVELGKWLEQYVATAQARWESFAVSLAVSNASGAAHAEALELVLELPERVSRGEAPEAIEAPPKRPTYEPPRPRSLLPGLAGWRGPFPQVTPIAKLGLQDVLPLGGGRRDAWQESADGRRLNAPSLDVQPGRSVEITAPLWLRARGPGVHEIAWTAYSQSLDRPVSGSFQLVVPEGDRQRPPFGRVEGILRFPDVELEIEADEGEREAEAGGDEEKPRQPPVRSADPPLAPPSEDAEGEGGGDALVVLRQASRRWEWEALGLDPALDGPSSERVQVGEARISRGEA